MATRGRVWSDQEVAALLAVWSEDSIQGQLLGAVRNTIPYKAIAQELSRQGFSRDYKQCREKVKALKKKYKEVVDAHRRSGAGVSSDDDSFEDVPGFRWFSEIHSIMRTRAVVSPPALLDTSVTGNQPAVTSDEHPRTPSVGEGRSRTPSVGEGRPRTPAVNEDRPRTPAVDEDRPRTPAVDEDQPRTPAVDEERPRMPAVVTEERPGTSSVTTQIEPSAEDVPGPSSATAAIQPRLPKKRKATKLDRAEKANKAMMDAFKELEEKSREQDKVQDQLRMKELRKLRKAEDKREKRFMEFLKGLFMQSSQQPYSPPMLPHQPVPAPLLPHQPYLPPWSQQMPFSGIDGGTIPEDDFKNADDSETP